MDRLIKKIVKLENPTVAGLDPKLSYIPEFIKRKAVKEHGNTLEAVEQSIFEFNKALIDQLYDIVPAVKPQMAYYEQYGWQGVRAAKNTIDYAKEKGMYVITDGKRNDIGTTMQAYANAFLGETEMFDESNVSAFNSDALTVNGYLGTDGVAPALDACKQKDGVIFVLVKTSNPSSGELQDREIGNKPVYEMMGEMCENWGSDSRGEFGYSSVGAVVGATYPDQLKKLREKLPHTFFLVPGYGAQGGGANDIAGAFKDGIGAIVNSSRGIMCAWQNNKFDEKDFALAAREEALRMKEDILSVI